MYQERSIFSVVPRRKTPEEIRAEEKRRLFEVPRPSCPEVEEIRAAREALGEKGKLALLKKGPKVTKNEYEILKAHAHKVSKIKTITVREKEEMQGIVATMNLLMEDIETEAA
jgi:hypothetical protein